MGRALERKQARTAGMDMLIRSTGYNIGIRVKRNFFSEKPRQEA